MSEPVDSGSVGLSCYPFGTLDMYGMKRLLSALDIKTDRIYRTVSAGKGADDRLLVVNIGGDRLKLRIIKREQPGRSIRMP